jgi:NitT/TauT family transport system permease protein
MLVVTRLNRTRRLAAPLVTLGAVIGVWWIGVRNVDTALMPSPGDTVHALASLSTDPRFHEDLLASLRRVYGGFAVSVLIGVPGGVALALVRPARVSVGPLVDAFRYLPVAAFIPLLILLLGIGDLEKVAVIALGTAPYLAILTAYAVRNVPADVVEAAHVLGASRGEILVRVIIPSAAPAIWDALRVTLGLAWTYLLTAELVGASVGLGSFILLSQRFLATQDIMACVLLIGIIAFGSELVLRTVGDRLFRWYRATSLQL